MTGTDVIIVVVEKVSSRLMMDWSTFVASKNRLSSENEQQKPSELDDTSSLDEDPMTANDHIYIQCPPSVNERAAIIQSIGWTRLLMCTTEEYQLVCFTIQRCQAYIHLKPLIESKTGVNAAK